MQLPRKISPLIVFGSLVIIIGLAILFVVSPLHSVYYGFLHQQDPRVICLEPPIEKKTMRALWNTIVNRTGIDPRSAEFSGMQVKVSPDETIEDLRLSFYATRNGEDRRFEVYLRYDPATCGMLYLSDQSSAVTGSSPRSPRNPGAILAELADVRPSVFGIQDQKVEILTEVIREKNGTYDSMPCIDLFALKNGTVSRQDRIIVHSTQSGATHWNIFPQRCVDVPGYDAVCFSVDNIHVISDQPVPGVEENAAGTGNNQSPAIHNCSSGPVTGQSCKSSLWGETCTNWTA